MSIASELLALYQTKQALKTILQENLQQPLDEVPFSAFSQKLAEFKVPGKTMPWARASDWLAEAPISPGNDRVTALLGVFPGHKQDPDQAFRRCLPTKHPWTSNGLLRWQIVT